MSNSSVEISDLLRPAAGINILITVGNTLRSDDGVGPYIFCKLSPRANLKIFNGGTNPENFLDEISALKPARIIIIDAADFGGGPGEAKIIPNDKIPESSLSTHALSLQVLARLLVKDTGARVEFLGIQPVTVAYGEGLSGPVREMADKIIKKIMEAF